VDVGQVANLPGSGRLATCLHGSGGTP
jgi:hypothetical protein